MTLATPHKTFYGNLRGVRQKALLSGFTGLVGVALALPAFGADYVWSGNTSADWFTGSNWTPNGFTPAAGDTVIIDTILSNSTLVSVAATTDLTELDVGNSGTGHLDIQNGGVVNATGGTVFLGRNANSIGTIELTGAGSKLNAQTLHIGEAGVGHFSAVTGSKVNTQDVSLGVSAGGAGDAHLDGAGSVWQNTSSLTVGDAGSGALGIQNGGVMTTGATVLGSALGSSGSITLRGANSQLTTGPLLIGKLGSGDVRVQNAGSLSSTGSISVGDGGRGVLAVMAGGVVTSASAIGAGFGSGAVGDIQIDGAGSAITDGFGFALGTNGIGTLEITNGGLLTTHGGDSYLGVNGVSAGTATVDGTNSTWDMGARDLVVGFHGTGALTVSGGGTVAGTHGLIAESADGHGNATVNGTGSNWTNSSYLIVGDYGAGSLTVSGGGAVTAGGTGIFLAENTGASGTVVVTGAGSDLATTGRIVIGDHGPGRMTVANGGNITAAIDVTIANNTAATGRLVIGADVGDQAVAPGTVTAPVVAFGPGTGQIVFNHTSANYTFSNLITGVGNIQNLSGVTHLTAASGGFTGDLYADGGTVLVDGTLAASTTHVDNHGTLGGTGAITGNVIVSDGGTLKGIQGQTLSMGDLRLSNASAVDVTLNNPSATALFDVSNNLILDGVLNITAKATFGPGVYRLINYAGALTNNGLDLGVLPDGTTASDYSIQTSVAGQINLIDTAAAQLRFWDGSTPANANNNVVDGGSGTWRVTSTSFTDGGGVSNGVQTPQPGFVVFQGNAGTVAVDNSAGAVAVTGMQFASGGYLINGDALTLAKAQTTIRVGDGTAAGSNYVATIAASLTGAGGLEKTDLGILVLSGVNTYTGETRITAGLLALAGTGSIATSSRVVDNGVFDIFFTTNGASITSLSGSGKVTLGSQMLTVTQANDDFSGVIDGPGGLTVSGGVQSLSGVNTYAGATTISGGTLALSGAGSIAASSGVVANGVFDISGTTAGATIAALSGTGSVVLGAQTLTMSNNFNAGDFFSGVISGSGGLNLQKGFFGLSGANTYTGLTTIANSASLLLGNAAATGSIVGDVANSGILGFSQSGVTTMSGAIFGSGRVLQAGLGTTTLSGVNTYTGGTIIATGLLRGSATSFGSGEVTNDAAFEINQATNAAFSNVISGAGTFTKSGAGSLDLTGTSTMTGATTVADGRLAVNGSLASSIVTIQSGGTLGGNGVVGGVVAQGGSVVGPGNSIGTLTVVGNYNQASGSTYQVEVTTTGQNDRVNVTGTATIASGANLNVVKTDPGLYVLGTRYTVLTATGGVNGTYTLSGDTSAFYGLVANYDANDVYLDVIHKKTFAEAGRTRNQIDAGGGLDGLPATNPLVAAVGKLPTDAAAQAALDQLSGESHASFKTALIEDSRFVRDAAINRVRAAFDALGTSNATAYAYDQQGTPQVVAANSGGLAFWGQGFGAWGSTDGDGNASHLGRATSGLLMGGDAPVLDGWRLGVMAGYSRTDVNTAASNASGTSDNYHLGIYTGTQIGALGIRGGAAYSRNEMHLNRSVSFAGFGDKLTSGYDGGTAQAFGELGYRIDAGHLTFEPFGGLAYVSLQTDGFAEHGGPAALTARGDTTDVTFTTLGLRGSSVMEIAGASVTTKGTLGWRHAYGDVTPISTFAFAGGSAFTVFGVPIARDSMVVDAGFDAALTRDISIGVSYSGQIAASARDNGFKANLNWKF